MVSLYLCIFDNCSSNKQIFQFWRFFFGFIINCYLFLLSFAYENDSFLIHHLLFLKVKKKEILLEITNLRLQWSIFSFRTVIVFSLKKKEVFVSWCYWSAEYKNYTQREIQSHVYWFSIEYHHSFTKST